MSKHYVVLILLLTAVGFAVGLQLYWLVAIFFLVHLVILFFGVNVPQLDYFSTSQHTLDKAVPFVALTFDDGPMPDFTPAVLDILKTKNVRACFFLIGKNMEGNEALVQRILAEGHQVGHHSYSHLKTIPVWSTQRVADDFAKAAIQLQDITHRANPFFRVPFGLTNPNIAKAVKRLSFRSIGWSLRTYDTMAKSKEQLLNRVLSNVKAGDIILMHDWGKFTIEALPEIIDGIRAKGLEFSDID